VDLDACGFTGLADAPSDVYGTILADRFEPGLAVAGLGERHRIQANYFKLYACCRYNHFALDAIGAICRAHRFAADEIASVGVTTIPFGLRMADPDPTTMLAAKFSIPWAIAARLVLGRADLPAFDERALGDSRIRDLARRVEVTADPGMSPRRTDCATARVRIALRDGRVLEEATTVVRGDADDPVRPEEIVDKFLALASPVVGESAARRVRDAALEVDALKDVRQLTALVAAA
jgi:2-methylcitrate dehydratase PrpD